MQLPFHVIMQLLDAPFHCIQASIYPVQNFKRNAEVPTANFLGIKHVTMSLNKTDHQSEQVQPEHVHVIYI
jgi:hypothetical protein